jgi:hypothetical protein
VSKDKKSKGGDYDVGYGKPPKEHQFPEKTSGNLKGRPKSGKLGSTDVSTVLNEPVKVKSGGKEREMSLFEAGLRQLARKALSKNLPAILKFIRICEEYRVIAPPPAATGGRVITAPKGVDFYEWLNSVSEEVPVDEA